MLYIMKAQSLTYLMEDLHQDINRVSSFIAGALMEHFLEGIATLKDIDTLTQMRRANTNLLFRVNLPKS